MWAHLLLVAAFLLSVPETTSASSKEAGLDNSSLKYVYAFFRHGIRAPLYNPYPSDPNKRKFRSLFKTLGELTVTGKKEMVEVGQKLSQTYGKFIGDYSDEKVYVTSTEINRTMMSAMSVMAGLFPPKKPLVPGLKWQPIPVFTDTDEFDKVYLYNDHDFPNLALKECPSYGAMIAKGYEEVLKDDKDEKRQPIYKLIQKYTKKNVKSINGAYEIYDILEMENLNGLKLPGWATMPRVEFGLKPLYPDLMRPIQVDWFYKCQWLHRDKMMLLFYSGPLFNSIYEHLNSKKERRTKQLFRYHNTHDDTILTLRWALGFDDPGFEVEAGDGIAFELHQQNGDFVVQVVYYHSLQRKNPFLFREVLLLTSFENFFKRYQRLTPEQWERKCKTNQ